VLSPLHRNHGPTNAGRNDQPYIRVAINDQMQCKHGQASPNQRDASNPNNTHKGRAQQTTDKRGPDRHPCLQPINK